MKHVTIMIIPDRFSKSKQIRIPSVLFKLLSVMSLIGLVLAGYLFNDYMELRRIRDSYETLSKENEGLRGEASVLMTNLEEIKNALHRVQDYTTQLGELTTKKVQQVRKDTGIGPLSREELNKKNQIDTTASVKPTNYLPQGMNLENLTFRPVFDRLSEIGTEANQNALGLQHLLSNLSSQKTLLMSIPSIAPVEGWISSGFGTRVSPFTGEKTTHAGLDIAADVGTGIEAPADGIVIFSGAKEGYGNFLMIAHGFGLVSHYGHIAQSLVEAGQKVRRGEKVATVGMTGRTTGPHLHYEVWVNGRAVDPRKFLLGSSDVELMAH